MSAHPRLAENERRVANQTEPRRRPMPMNAPSRSLIAVVLLLAASGSTLVPSPAAAETLRVGKAVPEAFSFVPLDVGMRKGLFANNGLEIESIAFTGDARMQQAMASDSLAVAPGSGPAMAGCADQGGRRHGRAAAFAGDRGATRRSQARRRASGHEDQRLDRPA